MAIFSSITRELYGEPNGKNNNHIVLYDGTDLNIDTGNSLLISIRLLEKLRQKDLIESMYLKDILGTRDQIEPELSYLMELETKQYLKAYETITKEELIYMEGFTAFMKSKRNRIAFRDIGDNDKEALLSAYNDYSKYVIDNHLQVNYNHYGSITNRVTMKEPNIQAMKKDRTRECIVAKEGHYLVELDYSQLDIFSLSMLSSDERLYQDLSEGIDMHMERLKYIYKDLSAIDIDTERSKIKQFSFQLQYGASIESMAMSTGLPIETIRSLIQEENRRYGKVAQFKETIYRFNEEMKTHNSTLSLPYGTFKAAKNGDTLVAHLTQGLGAYVLYYAVAKITHYADILFTVHDSIVIELPETEISIIKTLIDLMEDLSPIGLKRYKVSAKIGKDYYNLHKIT